jgi:hypothetical protein
MRALASLLALALLAVGCELFASVDRDEIPRDGGAGGGAASSSSTGTVDAGGPCITPMDCPGADTDCAFLTCRGGRCGEGFVASGTPTTTQVVGDCKRSVCDGKGGEALIEDDTNVPAGGNPCAQALCVFGAPESLPLPVGTACDAGGTVCDGAGHCVACILDAQCAAGGVCINNACNLCFDGKKDGAETDVDCGGPVCVPCAVGKTCDVATDCASGVCAGGVCAGPSGTSSSSSSSSSSSGP